MVDPIVVNTSPVPDVVMTLARDLLKAAGAVLATHGILSTSMVQAMIGLALLLVPIGWSLFVTWLRSSRFAALALDPTVEAVVAKGAEVASAKLATSTVAAAMLALMCVPLAGGLTGCAGLSANLSRQTSAQVATFAQAEQALAVALHGTAAWIRATHPSADTIAKVEAVEGRMKADVAQLRADRDASKPLAFSALNVALAELAAAEGGN